MSGQEAKSIVRTRNPKAVARRERINRMVPVQDLQSGGHNLRPESFDGYAVYYRNGIATPYGIGRTEDEAWLDCLA